VNVVTVVETTISAAHSVRNHPRCGEKHGHTWRIRFEIAADEKDLVDSSVEDIAPGVAQYQHTDLDRFLPGVETTPRGLAALFHDQYSRFPITAIEVVTDDGIGARVTWALR
jgi:hypothetical protein